MKICVVGLGYVGLPTAILLADAGHNVLGVDVSSKVLNGIVNGTLHIEDDTLDPMLRSTIEAGQFQVASQVEPADVYIICVPTPVKNRKIDLVYVESACSSIAPVLSAGNLVIIESTVAPGTTDGPVKEWLQASGLTAGVDFYLAHIPERVQPGHLYEELVGNDRVVGGIDIPSSEKATEVYKSFVTGQIEQIDAISAETIKVLENTYRDINIAIANEFMLICEKLNVDPWRARELANRHPRVNILEPGPGVGGHCIPVDPWFLVENAPEESILIRTARQRNDAMPSKVARDIVTVLSKHQGKKVAVLGCSYKANTSDDRESPTRHIVQELNAMGIVYSVFDPYILEPWPNGTSTLEEAVSDADLIAVIVPHDEFLRVQPKELAAYSSCKAVFDCTHKLDVTQWRNQGFATYILGEIEN